MPKTDDTTTHLTHQSIRKAEGTRYKNSCIHAVAAAANHVYANDACRSSSQHQDTLRYIHVGYVWSSEDTRHH